MTADDVKALLRIWDFKGEPIDADEADVLIHEDGWEVRFFGNNYMCLHIVTNERASEGTPIYIKVIGKGICAEMAFSSA